MKRGHHVRANSQEVSFHNIRRKVSLFRGISHGAFGHLVFIWRQRSNLDTWPCLRRSPCMLMNITWLSYSSTDGINRTKFCDSGLDTGRATETTEDRELTALDEERRRDSTQRTASGRRRTCRRQKSADWRLATHANYGTTMVNDNSPTWTVLIVREERRLFETRNEDWIFKVVQVLAVFLGHFAARVGGILTFWI